MNRSPTCARFRVGQNKAFLRCRTARFSALSTPVNTPAPSSDGSRFAQIVDARRAAETRQVREGEDVIGKAGRVGVLGWAMLGRVWSYFAGRELAAGLARASPVAGTGLNIESRAVALELGTQVPEAGHGARIWRSLD
jgi:hypothetical protein